jgi:hypothetical protein
MSNKELIDNVRTKSLELSELQRDDIADTSGFKNYNTTVSQIIKIRAMLNKDCDPAKVLPSLLNLQKVALAEFKSELPRMVDEKNLQKATELYEEITMGIKTLSDALEQPQELEQGFSM